MTRLASQVKAERTRDARIEQVQVRFSKAEAAAVDAARGDVSRPKWLKALALKAAAKRAR